MNGEKPHIMGRSLLVSVGEVNIDIQYFISGDSFGSTHTNVFPRGIFTLSVQRGFSYHPSYDLMEKEYTFKQKEVK